MLGPWTLLPEIICSQHFAPHVFNVWLCAPVVLVFPFPVVFIKYSKVVFVLYQCTLKQVVGSPYVAAKHDDVIKWKHFPRYWPFVRGIHRSPVNSQHKGQWHGALIFTLILLWRNGGVNNREAGDLRRHRAHYGVIVMVSSQLDGTPVHSARLPRLTGRSIPGPQSIRLLKQNSDRCLNKNRGYLSSIRSKMVQIGGLGLYSTIQVSWIVCFQIYRPEGVEFLLILGTRSCFNIMTSPYPWRTSHCWDKTIIKLSYLHKLNSFTG